VDLKSMGFDRIGDRKRADAQRTGTQARTVSTSTGGERKKRKTPQGTSIINCRKKAGGGKGGGGAAVEEPGRLPVFRGDRCGEKNKEGEAKKGPRLRGGEYLQTNPT